MKRTSSLLCCCLVACTLPAMAQKKGAETGDQSFVDFAAQTDMVEANLGQLAQKNATSQAVKDYGQMLVTDHTSDFSQLYTAAKQTGLNRPDAIDTEHNKALIGPMEKLNGAAFDHKFIQEMVAGHTAALARYKKEAADAKDPTIKSYAQAAVPVLEKHLDAAKNLQKTAGK